MTESPARLHRGARLEDALMARAAWVLRRRGWRPQVVPYTGYGAAADAADGEIGAEGWVRVLARVRLGPPAPGPQAPAGARWWRKFFTVAAPGVPVSVTVGDRQHDLASGRGGYIDVVLAGDLEAGWHDVEIRVEGRSEATEPVRVVGADERWGLVSDIDDTVMVTALPRPLLAFWNTFVVKETSRRPVPGMAALYRGLRADDPDGLVVYLSTGAWNVAPALSRFLDRSGYPRGPLLMTDWGPTTEGWFRSGRAHKHRELRRLVADLPQLRWVLVGDDGQHDPQLYRELADEAPGSLRMVLIRQLSAVEQVLTHGIPPVPAAPAPEAAVAWFYGEDGDALTRQLP